MRSVGRSARNLLLVFALPSAFAAILGASTGALADTVTMETTLVPAKSQTAANAEFGQSVAVSASVVVVGAGQYDGDGSAAQANAGRAFVFDVGSTIATILPRTGASRIDESQFGYAVAVDGTRVVVAAPYESLTGTAGSGSTEEGAVYVYDRGPSSSWIQIQRLTAGADAAAGDWFGSAIDIDGDVIAVGVPDRNGRAGVVYLFVRNASGTYDMRLPISAPAPAANAGFGSSVALDDGTLFVKEGSKVHVYRYDPAGSATFSETLTGMGTVDADHFGWPVAADGAVLAVGASGYGGGTGAVFVFERGADGKWTQRQRLDGTATGGLGSAVAVSGDFLLAGGPATSVGTTMRAGSARLFYRNPVNGAWGPAATIPATAPMMYDNYGWAVGIAGNLAVVGAIGVDGNTLTDSGAAAFVRFRLTSGSACRSIGAGVCEQGFCVDGVCCATACDGACDSCSAATGASADGTCGLRLSSLTCRPAVDACDVAETCTGTSNVCPADQRIPACTLDAGTDGGDDGAVPATVPRRDLSCTCNVAGQSGSPTLGVFVVFFGLGTVIVLRGAMRSRKRRRASRGA